MFSPAHLMMLAASVISVIGISKILGRKQIPLERMLFVCGCIALACECVKIVLSIEMVPLLSLSEAGLYQQTGAFIPHMNNEDIPMELCSMQIVFIWLAYFLKPGKLREKLLSFLYVTMIIGATLALLMPEPLLTYRESVPYYLSLRIWEFYIYHIMLVVLGLFLYRTAPIRAEDFFSTTLMIGVLDLLSFYANSVMAVSVYSDGQIVGVTSPVNFFSSYRNPLGLNLTTKGQWLAYLGIRYVLALLCIGACFVPFSLRRKKQ